jgi:hypothetical protein
MNKHQSEKRTIEDRQRRRRALGEPEHFYLRPQDVLDDDSLSDQDKLSLLDNLRVALEDRAGAVEPPSAADEQERQRERDELEAAIARARARLQ